MWKNTVQRGWPQMTIWRMRTACWVPRSTHTHTHTSLSLSLSLSLSHNMQYLFLFHYNNGCTNAPQCYVTRTYIACLVLSTFNLRFGYSGGYTGPESNSEAHV